MTDVVVYLRGQDLSRLAQEEIRRDILEMVLAGEARGQTMQQVIGLDYRTFCDEIVAAVPGGPGVRMLSAVDDMPPRRHPAPGHLDGPEDPLSPADGAAGALAHPHRGGRDQPGLHRGGGGGLGDLGLPHRSPPAPGGGRRRGRGACGRSSCWRWWCSRPLFLPRVILPQPLVTLWMPAAVVVTLLPPVGQRAA